MYPDAQVAKGTLRTVLKCGQGAERQQNERSADAESAGAAERRSGGAQ